jgi:pteridine reductase
MDRTTSLAGRTLLVTGGAHRVGAAIVRRLAAQGARVLVHYHGSEAAARELVAGLPGDGGGACFQADLGDPEGARRLFAACAAAGESPDGLVHAAASFLRRSFEETTTEEWDHTFDLNLRSLFLLVQELARFRGEAGGDVVAICDSAALELWTEYLVHSVAKAAMVPLIQGLAKALAPRFRVNGVIPGPVLPPAAMSPEELAAIRERTLLKRLGDPDHVAQAVQFLLTCDYATGSMVEVTGGSQFWRQERGKG